MTRPLDRGHPYARLAAARRRLRRKLHVSARPVPGGARARGRARLPRREPRRARAAAADQAASAVPAAARGRPAARVGRQDDSRGRLLRAARAPERRRRAVRGRHGRVRGRALAQGHPLRDAVGDLRRPGRLRGAQARATCRAAALAAYDRMVDESYIVADLHRTRNMRLAFKDGLYVGGLKAGLMTAHRRPLPRRPDRDARGRARRRGTWRRAEPFVPDGKLTFSKLDAVFKSGNATRDTIPSHLLVGRDMDPEVADFYARLSRRRLRAGGRRAPVNPPNCVDCKATDVLGPRWTPREGGSGPKYRAM